MTTGVVIFLVVAALVAGLILGAASQGVRIRLQVDPRRRWKLRPGTATWWRDRRHSPRRFKKDFALWEKEAPTEIKR
jgi:hypothetical protein